MSITARLFKTLSLAAAFFDVSGCDTLVQRTEKAEVSHLDNAPLRVETAYGGIEIAQGAEAKVIITAEIRARGAERLAKVALRSERGQDGTLKVWIDWPDGQRLSNEGASITVRLPNASAVVAVTTNGAIGLENVGRSADLDTSNGSIQAKHIGGPVKAHSSNGKITLEAIAGDVHAVTSNGRIDAREVQGHANLKSSDGAVELRLAPGAAGPFQVSTSNGSVLVEVPESFNGEVSASTANGSVRMDGGGGDGRSSKALTRTFGSGGEKSCATTTNGSVTIRGGQ